MTEPFANIEKLEEIGQLQQALWLVLEAETVECPMCLAEQHGEGGAWCSQHDIADGTGRTPDPSMAPLLEVIREKCPCQKDGTLADWRLLHHDTQTSCKGTGYVLRDWSETPEGALAGAGYRAMRALHLQDPSLATFRFVELWWSDMRSDANPDPATLKAMLAAVQAQRKGG
ncbi:MAG: hypothetical protein ABID84_00085 [Chloroflexota bacterium]